MRQEECGQGLEHGVGWHLHQRLGREEPLHECTPDPGACCPRCGPRGRKVCRRFDAVDLLAGLDIGQAFLDQVVAEAHQDADSGVILRRGEQVFLQEGGSHPRGEKAHACEEAEGRETIVESLYQSADVLALLNHAELGAEADFTELCRRSCNWTDGSGMYLETMHQHNIHCPPGKVKNGSSFLTNFSSSLLLHS